MPIELEDIFRLQGLVTKDTVKNSAITSMLPPTPPVLPPKTCEIEHGHGINVCYQNKVNNSRPDLRQLSSNESKTGTFNICCFKAIDATIFYLSGRHANTVLPQVLNT